MVGAFVERGMSKTICVFSAEKLIYLISFVGSGAHTLCHEWGCKEHIDMVSALEELTV